MHTKVCKSGIVFNFYGGYEGNIIISLPSSNGKYIEVTVPFDDFKGLVADYVREKRINELE